MDQEIRGHIILIMAPMASGKGMLISHVMERFPAVKRLVSCTTRPRRPTEAEGVDYFFLSRPEFERRIKDRAFIEWTEFSGNLYGTLRSEIMDHLMNGDTVINEMDLTGVRRLLTLIPRDRITVVYVDAGDWETLKTRALARAPMSAEELDLRRAHYHEERAFRNKADVIISNNDNELDDAKSHIERIVGDILAKKHV